MKAKVEVPTGQSYAELLTLAANLTDRIPGFAFVRFQAECFVTLSCDPKKRNPDLHLYLIGEITASDN